MSPRDKNRRPGLWRYKQAMGESWMTTKEIALKLDTEVETVNTIVRRWEEHGYVERRVRDVARGRKPIEWRIVV